MSSEFLVKAAHWGAVILALLVVTALWTDDQMPWYFAALWTAFTIVSLATAVHLLTARRAEVDDGE